jgi:hypothetical protein
MLEEFERERVVGSLLVCYKDSSVLVCWKQVTPSSITKNLTVFVQFTKLHEE